MQKKIIVLAIAAALTAPAVALADAANVTPYGGANMSVDRITTGANLAGDSGTSKLVVNSNQTFFGLKGSEDLDGGMTAVWQIESLVQIDSAGGTLATRNSFLGLKGGAGTVLLGRHDTPYKMSTRKLDVFADGLADNRSLMGYGSKASFDGRQPDVLAYVSPTFSGVTAVIARVNLAEGNTASTAKQNTAMSMAAMYGSGPIYASLAYETHSFDAGVYAAASTSEKATKLSVGYTKDAMNVGVVYEKVADDFNTDHTSIYVSGKFAVAGGAVKAAITKRGELGTTAKSEAQQISLGYDHNLSKRTVAYVSYTKLTNGDAVANGLATTSSAVGTVNGVGAAPSALSFGMKHSF